MYLVVGLGNPEPEYSNSRHNMGFDVINKMARVMNTDVKKTKHNGIFGTGDANGEKVILLKPQTYMNASGECIIKYANFYKIPIEDIIVVYDDIDIKPGEIKIRKQGGPGNHNGMKSVVENLNSEKFTRIRVGIGKPENKNELVNYVLEKIPNEQRKVIDIGIERAQEAVMEILKNGVDSAMNKFN